MIMLFSGGMLAVHAQPFLLHRATLRRGVIMLFSGGMLAVHAQPFLPRHATLRKLGMSW
jgi:hypothetical protein